jgi:putative ABC transport system substrate-binding protein
VVAFINAGSADGSAPRAAAFRKGLNETSYVEGQDVTVEYHWLEGHYAAVCMSAGPRAASTMFIL